METLQEENILFLCMFIKHRRFSNDTTNMRLQFLEVCSTQEHIPTTQTRHLRNAVRPTSSSIYATKLDIRKVSIDLLQATLNSLVQSETNILQVQSKLGRQ